MSPKQPDIQASHPQTVSPLFGVPWGFSEIMEVTAKVVIQKGQLNKASIKPRIINEHVESSREIQGVVDATNIVGQVVRLSKDNITGMALTLESAAGILLDNFESYANSAALQAVWVASGELATLDSAIFKSGTQSMSLPLTNGADSWAITIPSTDYTEFTGSFDFYQSTTLGLIKVYIEDSLGNKKFSNIPVVNANEWQHVEVLESSMTEDPGNGADTNVTDIIIVGFEVVTKRTLFSANIDNLSATPPPGNIEVKFWDMGETPPISTINSIDDGNQYMKVGGASASYLLPLSGGKRLYHIHQGLELGAFKNEPTNETLNPGNYYIIELKYVDTDINVYGPDTSFAVNYYESGYAFTAPDEATAITATGPYSDIMFFLQSMQDIYITQAEWRFDTAPNGNSDLYVFAEDANMDIVGVIVDHEESPDVQETKNIENRPIYLEDGGKLEFYYNDDFTDSVANIIIEMQYVFQLPETNG